MIHERRPDERDLDTARASAETRSADRPSRTGHLRPGPRLAITRGMTTRDAGPSRSTSSASRRAADEYAKLVADIRATIDVSSREFAIAMTEASARYERAMIADVGVAAARRLGAGLGRLGRG